MQRRADGSWLLTARRAPLVRSLVAAWLLAAVGALLGGVVGWTAFAFFGLAGVLLVTRLASTRVVATFAPEGVSLVTSPGGVSYVSWDDIEALLLWTQAATVEGRVDRLGVVTVEDLHLLGTGTAWGGWADDRAPAPAIDPGRVLGASTSLADCRVDADMLR